MLSTDNSAIHFDDDQLNAIMNAYNSLDLPQKAFFVIVKKQNGLNIYTYEQYLQLPDNESWNIYYVLSDSSTDKNPSSALRNYLLLILHHFNSFSSKNSLGREIMVLSLRFFRDNHAYHCRDSLVYKIRLPEIKGSIKDIIHEVEGGSWIGWERNERSKLGPRMVNLKNSMDPKW